MLLFDVLYCTLYCKSGRRISRKNKKGFSRLGVYTIV
jgi:hypothetical protein